MNKSTLARTLSCCVALLFAACESKHEIGFEAPDSAESTDVGRTPVDSGQTSQDATMHEDATSANNDAEACTVNPQPSGPCNLGICAEGEFCLGADCFGCSNGTCAGCIPPDADAGSQDAINIPDATENADAGATDAAECILAHDPLGPCNEGACPTGSLCISGNCFGCYLGDCTPCIGADQ